MLLKHLYDFAQSRNLLDDLAFTKRPVRWIIEINSAGHLQGGIQITGDDKRGKEFSCPQTTRPKVAGGVAEFLADGLTSVFGLDPDPDSPMPEAKRISRLSNNAAKQSDFWRQIKEGANETKHAGLQAALLFRENLPSLVPRILRWGTAPDAKPGAKSGWWVRAASGGEIKLGPENFTFRVNGNLLLEDPAIQDFWRKAHVKEADAARSNYSRGLCLVSGKENQSLAPTHNPKIKGVPNTQSFGAAIVSFDKQSFGSYGFDQSLNAPTAENAATAYCVALNWLLGQDDHSLRVGQTCLCFWAREAANAGSFFARLLNRPDAQAVAQFLKSPWAGMERDLARRDQFFAVTLAGNSGRIVVRHWQQGPLDQAIEHFRDWFADLSIAVPQRPESKVVRKTQNAGNKSEYYPLSIYRLASTTVREAKDLSPDVPSQLYRAAFDGTAPSVLLIKPLLDQLHSRLVRDRDYTFLYDQSRFALLKLILNRNRNQTTMEIKTELTTTTDDAAYNCGRLLAILSAAQSKAHDYKLEGSGVAERYFGTASVSPMSVFPLLLRLNRHHLDKIRKAERFRGHERFIEEQLQGVLALFKPAMPGQAPVFPRTLDLQGQGRFALGFYQQQAAEAAARQAARDKRNDSKIEIN
jgi:CRISPR-associated protein Csd1